MTALAANKDITIAQSDTVAEIQTKIQNAINASNSGDTITVTGIKSDAGTSLGLNIKEGVTVVWKASYSGSVSSSMLRLVAGHGIFEVADGHIRNDGDGNTIDIVTDRQIVRVSGGAVEATGASGIAILAQGNETNIIVRGGTVESKLYLAICNKGGGLFPSVIQVSGGAVKANGINGFAVCNSGENSRILVSGGTVVVDAGIAIANIAGGSDSKITVSGGTVKATTGVGIGVNDTNTTVTVSGGDVSATTGAAIGVNADQNTIEVNSGSVSATTGFGIAVNGKDVITTVNGGNVSATTGAAIGVNADQNTIRVNGGSVSAAVGFGIAVNGKSVVTTVDGGVVSSTNQAVIAVAGNDSKLTVKDGFVFANGTDIIGEGKVINMVNGGAPTIGGVSVVCAWDKPSDAPIYNEGSSNNLTVAPGGAMATWGKSGAQSGISYKNGSNSGFFPVSGVTVSAATATQYIVAFNSNGGSAVTSQSVNAGDKAEKPADPTKTGATFVGWHTDAALTTTYDFNAPVTANLTLYADWTTAGEPDISGPAGAPAINGPTSMTLTVGYTATSTGVFTITGVPAPIVEKISGNAAILWNGRAKKLEIGAGLEKGTYNVLLKATNAAGEATFDFTFIVTSEAMDNTVTPPPGSGTPFPFVDVLRGDWFYNDVKAAWEMGLVNGSSDTTYSPYNNMTYAEAVKLAACMHQYYMTGGVTLVIGSPQWYQSYVDYAKANSIISKDYDWDAQATRAGYMEIFANSLPAAALSEINTVTDGTIPDVPATHPQAAAIYKLYRAGIVQGVDDAHNCSPDSNILRNEVAAIIARMMDPVARVDFTLG